MIVNKNAPRCRYNGAEILTIKPKLHEQRNKNTPQKVETIGGMCKNLLMSCYKFTHKIY